MRKFLLMLFTTLLLALFTACGGDDGAQTAEDVEVEEIEETEDVEKGETVYPLTVTDASGEEITFESAPERIVSISPSETEILFALGLGDEVVGVTDFDDYPEEVFEKEKIGGLIDPNEEAILELEPDLVITGLSISDDIVENLRGLGLEVYKTDANSLDDVLSNIDLLGEITNSQSEAEALISEMEETIEKVKSTVASLDEEEKKKVYIEYNPGWTVGDGEFMNELIELSGGINIAADESGWIEINEEKIIQDDPDVIIYAANLVDEESGKKLDELIKDRSGWDKITAIEEDHFVPMDESIMSRVGPRVTLALEQIAEGIYPELFEQ